MLTENITIERIKEEPETFSGQRELIIHKLKESGCRITRQRMMLLNVILENECSSCKEIYYKASKLDNTIGTATVYRMINTLEEIGAINRKNLYKLTYSDQCTMEDACTVVLDDHTVHHISGKKWNEVVLAGLRQCGYIHNQKVTSIMVKPCECEKNVC